MFSCRPFSVSPMVRATFKFQENLNHFLAFAHRCRSVECVCAESATTKHMIEALGVPHTEVGAVTVNHQKSSLEHLLQDGDHVVVHALSYPVDTGTGSAAPGFVADAHLGGLARLLRMAGFNTLYDNTIQDDALVRIATDEHRVILSRDRELLKRRAVLSGCYIRSLQPAVQMKEVVDRFGLARQARPLSLCLQCNKSLTRVDKSEVLDMLPPSVQEHQNEFSRCPCCKRVYWKGSHWQRMQTMLQAIITESTQHNPG